MGETRMAGPGADRGRQQAEDRNAEADRLPRGGGASGGALSQMGVADRARMVLALQLSFGNGAVAGLLHGGRRVEVQRACSCGTACPTCQQQEDVTTPCGGLAFPVQRSTASVVQRDKDPADLTGTPFVSLDGNLQTKLKDKTSTTGEGSRRWRRS